MPTRGWRCFHCDEHFTLRSDAAAHFGYQQDATPACRIAPDLRGLIGVMRLQEGQLHRFRQEDSDAARQFYALGAEHSQALRREEEKGYERGLKDGSTSLDARADRVDASLARQLSESIARNAQIVAENGRLRSDAQLAMPSRETIAKALWRRRRHYEPTDGQLHGSVTGRDCLADADAFLAICPTTSPEGERKSPADQIVTKIEGRFPNWRSYRDLIDCIDCTLHDLRGDRP